MSPALSELEVFLARRLSNPSSEWVGVSSNAMVVSAMTGNTIDKWDYPSDFGDLGRCCGTFARAPYDLRKAMLPILRAYCEHIEQKYGVADTTEAG